MKKILKYYTLIAVALVFTVSCNWDDTNYDGLFNNPDKNASYFAQFTDAAQTFESGVNLDGSLIDIETKVSVALMGLPQNEDITIDIAIDPSSTLTPDMYILSATSITIPAGKTAGAVTLKTKTENMPAGEQLTFALNLDAGDNNTPNANGAKLHYKLKRIEFCPLNDSPNDLAGSYSVTVDGDGYANPISSVASGTKLKISGLGEGMIVDFWGEPVVAGGTCEAIIAPNGLLEIPRQFIFTTVYGGANYDYEIKGSGTWTNCGVKPTLTITYDIYYPGDAEGLAVTYASYFKGPYLNGTFTMN